MIDLGHQEVSTLATGQAGEQGSGKDSHNGTVPLGLRFTMGPGWHPGRSCARAAGHHGSPFVPHLACPGEVSSPAPTFALPGSSRERLTALSGGSLPEFLEFLGRWNRAGFGLLGDSQGKESGGAKLGQIWRVEAGFGVCQ